MGIRKARIDDVRRIKQLIDNHMHEGFMLPRPLSELYENLRDFYVVEEDGMVHGCVGLHIVWEDLAEVKSLVVDHYGRNKGWGRKLVEACLEEARALQIKRVFALTQVPRFFYKLGFSEVDRAHLPHKVWAECIKCHKFPECDEVAVGVTVCETPSFAAQTTGMDRATDELRILTHKKESS
ncbi:MAG: N-acetyltransferase [bacterium]|jgi:amino-acid N-acetyltransferase